MNKLILSLLLPLCGLTAAPLPNAAPEAFLDAPSPVPIPESFPRKDLPDLVGQAGGRDPVVSPELRQWLDEGRSSMHSAGKRPSGISTRQFLDAVCSEEQVQWSYDPDRQAIRLDFPWRRADDRTTAALLAFLTEHRPAPAGTWHRGSPPDPWTLAFDALLSKEPNFPHAWRVRAWADATRIFSLLPIENIYAGPFRDSRGKTHILIVNNQPMTFSPGEGSVSYYVFDAEGRFEQGGLFNTGHRVASISGWKDSKEDRLDLEGWFNGQQRVEQTYALSDSGLVLTSEAVDGKPQEAREHDGYHMGDRILSVAAGPQGLDSKAELQNAWNLFFRNPESAGNRAAVVARQRELLPDMKGALFTFWDHLGGREFLPVVRQAARAPEYNGAALTILEKLAPEEATPMILADIQGGVSRYAPSNRSSYPAAFPWLSMPKAPIPDLTAFFRRALKDPKNDPSTLLPLVERYGVPGLLPDVVAFYRPRAGNWECAVEDCVLKFWIRNDPKAGAEALERTLASRDRTRCYAFVLKEVLLDEWTDLALPTVRKALADPEEDVVMEAIEVLRAKGGSDNAAAVIAALERIDRTPSQPGEDSAEIRTRRHALLARTLLESKTWSYSPDQRQRLETLSKKAAL